VCVVLCCVVIVRVCVCVCVYVKERERGNLEESISYFHQTFHSEIIQNIVVTI